VDPVGTGRRLADARESLAGAYDQHSNRLIIFGGFPTGQNEVWTLSNANGLDGTPQWMKFNPKNSPARYGIPGCYDPTTNRLMFALGADPAAASNPTDAWVLSNAGGTSGPRDWTRLSVTGTPPPPRQNHGAAYDRTSNRMIIHGGTNGSYLSDTWILTEANGVVSSQLEINRVFPNEGGNSGKVTLEVVGTGLVSGAAVKLSAVGQTDIIGAIVSATSDLLTVTFDLTVATPGVRDLVITNPDGSSVTSRAGFKVLEGGAPDLWVDLVGRSEIRAGLQQTYYLVAGNSGTIDATPSIGAASFPLYLTWDVKGTG
jgi:hypothetical protein